jgi:hypothetical protein
MKICTVQAQLLHADGQTVDHDNANSSFVQFSKCAQWKGIMKLKMDYTGQIHDSPYLLFI